MAIETDLSQSPYFDDFNEEKNFHRVLFRPGYAVQARELTQMQSILQNQIERFANEVVVDGTVITGCGLITDGIQYVKLRDKDASNRVLLLGDFYSNGLIANAIVYGANTGVVARLVDAKEGSESAAPNYLTIFVQYLNAGVNNERKTFANNEVLLVRTNYVTPAGTISAFSGNVVTGSGTSFTSDYSVGDYITITDGANTIDDYVTSIISDTSMQLANTISYTRSSVSLSHKSSEFIVTANTIQTDPTGMGFRASVDGGIIYHKGNFVRVDPQSIVVSKYSTTPTVKLGFETRESIVDSNADSSLLDNATGATNYAAPGANRLKMTPVLAFRDPAAANTTTFFSFANIEDGKVIQRFTDTVYSDLGKFVNKKFYETHGDYAVEPFNLRVREHLKTPLNIGRYDLLSGGSHEKLAVEVEKGVGYISGNRVALENSVYVDVDKGIDTAVEIDRLVGHTIGHYVNVKEVVGQWNFKGFAQVSLYSAAQEGITGGDYGDTTATGSAIGTARVRGIEWDSGTAGTADGRFRIYLFDVQMNTGYSFADVRSLFINRGSGLNSCADIVLETNGTAKIQEAGLNSLVFPFTQKGTKTLKDGSDTNNTDFVIRKALDVTIGTTGQFTVTVGNTATGTSGEILNDSGTLSAADRRNFIVVATEDAETETHTGTISDISGTTVTGSGTAFQTDYVVGELITIESSPSETSRIVSIASDTSLTVADSLTTATGASYSHRTSYPAGYIFDLTANGAITGSSSSLTVDISRGTLTSDTTATVYYDVKRNSAVQTAKTANKNKFIKLNTGSHTASKFGPWPLGVSDAFGLLRVYKGSNTGVSTSDIDVTDQFELDTGMKDGYYDTAYLKKKSTSSLDLTNCGLIVEFNYFGRDTSAGYGFLSVDSYPIDDTNPTGPTTITTQEIPIFTSPTTGRRYDLRDCVDYRLMKANTCAPTGVASTAPTNPTVGTTFSYVANFGVYNPAPDENFECDLQYYLPRKDRIVLTSEGRVEAVRGVSSLNPRVPEGRAGAMSLGILDIPVYPSVSPYIGNQLSRQDYTVKLSIDNNRRYTMKDLRAVDQRVKNLEYYSSLNALETSARNKQLFGPTGIERFKNGFLVDNFEGHNVADNQSVSYSAAIDVNRSLLRPTFDRQDISLSNDIINSSENATVTGDLITCEIVSQPAYLTQRFASKLRNPVQELTFNWIGEVLLTPSMDNTPDITTLPDIQVDLEGLNTSSNQIANVTGKNVDWGTWETTNTTTTTEQVGDQIVTTVQSEQIRSGIQTTTGFSVDNYSLGSYVTDVSVRDYMRSRLVRFKGVRLKPNTRVYAYFDNEAVSEYCTPTNSSYANTGIESANLITDSSGTVHGLFRIPNNQNLKFRVGTRRFTLKDVANTITQSSLITTSAHGDYTSIPLNVVQQGISLNIKTNQTATEQITDNQTLTTVTTQPAPIPPDPPVVIQPCGNVLSRDTSICISVVDESSVAAGTLSSDYDLFVSHFPNRELFVLQPGNKYPKSRLRIPSSFDDATYYKSVNRDKGNVSFASDWFTLCGLSSLSPGEIVSLAIDGSGSMRRNDVRASYDKFISDCQAAGIVVNEQGADVKSGGMAPKENWIRCHDRTLGNTVNPDAACPPPKPVPPPPRRDPLSQTFTISAGDSDGIFVTKMDLFFGRKSNSFPITVQIREVLNGFPTQTIVPFGSATLDPSSVNVDLVDGSEATTFIFPSPVFLKNNVDYAFVVMPAGNNDEYAVWTAELGGKDVATNELIDKQPAGGVMFTSANDKTWSPVQNEDIKFTIYKAQFNTTDAATVYLENDPIEYLTVDNFLKGNLGYVGFNQGEKVRGEATLVLTGVTGNTTDTFITVGTEIANTENNPGPDNRSMFGVIRTITNEYANGTVRVTADVQGSAYASTMAANSEVFLYDPSGTFDGYEARLQSFTASNDTGYVNFVDYRNGKMNLDNSAGGFTAGEYIRGQVSGASARIASVDNPVLNTMIPRIPQLTYANTSASWAVRTTSGTGTISSTYTTVDLDTENNFRDAEKKVYSKSTEDLLVAVDGSRKTLTLRGTLSTNDPNVSPVIDLTRTNAIAVKNNINNSFVDEQKDAGEAQVRYMTRPIELADGQEAEDLLVYLMAYKPQTTDIKVYARIKGPEDPQGFAEKDWSLLRQVTAANVYSDTVNTKDYKEFEYTFSSNTDGMNFLGSSANNTAYLNTANSDVVAYIDSDGSIHHTFKTYAIKIVMTAAGTNLIPLVRDMRAIALQK